MAESLSDYEALSEISEDSETSEASSMDETTFNLLNYKLKYRKVLHKLIFLEQQLEGQNKLIKALTDENKCYKYSFLTLSGGILAFSFYILNFLDRNNPKIILT